MLHYYATTTLEEGIRGNQPKKIKKNQIKINYIKTPCFTRYYATTTLEEGINTKKF